MGVVLCHSQGVHQVSAEAEPPSANGAMSRAHLQLPVMKG
jgi:hypothetical protein